MNHQKIISFSDAAERLTNGEVGVIHTDTIYGLAALAKLPSAITKLYALKHREQKPGTVIAANTAQLEALGISKQYLDQVAHLWPASLSIVLPISNNPYLHQGIGSLAVRVVADSSLQSLLQQTGPLLTSSANQPGQPESNSASDAWEYFGDTVDFYVDGGNTSHHKASTIIRLLPGGQFELLREGAVDVSELLFKN